MRWDNLFVHREELLFMISHNPTREVKDASMMKKSAALNKNILILLTILKKTKVKLKKWEYKKLMNSEN